MKIDEIAKQLKGKRKSVSDLVRFISTQTEHNPNYTLLLGAGCSITSDINSAIDLTRQWRNELCGTITDIEEQRAYLKQEHGDWYDPAREYASLFEKKYDLQRQRRMFVEKEVSGKIPSLGYAYLTALVNQNYFNTIFTTNFDDLINEAFYLYSDKHKRPIVCAHDSSINSITVTSKRPKVIKLHGDYLFDDLKATTRETESLEQNMKRKFSEFSKDYGLIVIGYSGGDRSIMDTLTSLLKSDEYFKSGIYWCIRKDSEVSEELRKLLWKEKVYFVEIEGFDEFFAELYQTINKGEELPFSTISISRRPTEIVHRLLSMQGKFPTESPILKKAHELLMKQSKKATLMEMVYQSETNEFKDDEKFSDDELITQLEIQNLIESGNYQEAILKGRAALRNIINPAAKRRMLTLIIQANRYLGELSEAVSVVEELILFQPHNSANYLLKSGLLSDRSQKIASVEKAIEVNQYFARSYYEKAALYVSEARSSYGDDCKQAVEVAQEALRIGLLRDPSIHNPCWALKFSLIKEFQKDKQVRDAELNKIIQQLCEMNPNSSKVLTLRQQLLTEEDRAELNVLLGDISRIKQRSDPTLHAELDVIRLQSTATCNNTQEIARALSSVVSEHDLMKNHELALVVAELTREKLGRDDDAVTFNGKLSQGWV
ncbi:SIR2 family protein [Nitrosovibrio sp. Nv6]|uniref:SIR2 family protein n=1 Tax=Nitrosovibrio sp. Nv6 TaxID=1855340 RepID=UPI0008C4816E|nr:SIR2 family protein [Nitrosovibrio sp. Nv6]SEP38870.1 SIR2-like domain-containing protein [Nitrosovibrio sp. Nv6]